MTIGTPLGYQQGDTIEHNGNRVDCPESEVGDDAANVTDKGIHGAPSSPKHSPVPIIYRRFSCLFLCLQRSLAFIIGFAMAPPWDRDSPPTTTRQPYQCIPGAYVVTTTSVVSHKDRDWGISKKKHIEFPPGFVLPPDMVLTPAEKLDLRISSDNERPTSERGYSTSTSDGDEKS